MRDLPLAVPLDQSEYVGSSRLGTRQLARPAFDFQMNDSDALYDLDSAKRGIMFGAGPFSVIHLKTCSTEPVYSTPWQ